MKTFIITYNKEITETDKLFGFTILDKEHAKNFIKAIKKLETNNSTFEMLGDEYEYQLADFEYTPITSGEIKILQKFFDFDFDNLNSESPIIGSMPDASQQYYDEYSDDNDEYDNDDNIEEDY